MENLHQILKRNFTYIKEEDQNVIGLRVSNIGCDSCELEIDWESYNNFRTYNGEVY